MALDPENDFHPGDFENIILRKILARLPFVSGGGGGGVTQTYVDMHDAATLLAAMNFSTAGDATTLASAAASASALYVLKAGDTMTGRLTTKLNLQAGSVVALTAPIKMTTGALLTVPEVGAIEFLDAGTNGHLYATVNVAGVATRLQLDQQSSGGPFLPLAGGTLTGTLTITPAINTSALSLSSYSISGANDQSLLSMSGTWNTSGAPKGMFLNITNMASDGASRLMDLQTGAISVFEVLPSGGVLFPGFSHDPTGDFSIGQSAIFYDSGIPGLTVGKSGELLGFYGDTGSTRATVNLLVNNITSGGTADTLTDWTSLTVYTTDAAAIRNAIYQLGQKVLQLQQAMVGVSLIFTS